MAFPRGYQTEGMDEKGLVGEKSNRKKDWSVRDIDEKSASSTPQKNRREKENFTTNNFSHDKAPNTTYEKLVPIGHVLNCQRTPKLRSLTLYKQ